MSSTNLELVCKATLGSLITIHRPSADSDNTSLSWITLDEELNVVLRTDDDYNLRLRIAAEDGAGDPISNPAWVVKAYTSTNGTAWTPLVDRDSHSAHFLTDHHLVDMDTRIYRFTVTIPGSGLEESFDITVHRHDPNAAPDDDDVIFVPEDDFGPTVGNGNGNTAPEPLTAGDLADPV